MAGIEAGTQGPGVTPCAAHTVIVSFVPLTWTVSRFRSGMVSSHPTTTQTSGASALVIAAAKGAARSESSCCEPVAIV